MEIHCSGTFPSFARNIASLSFLFYLHRSHGRRPVSGLWSFSPWSSHLPPRYVEIFFTISFSCPFILTGLRGKPLIVYIMNAKCGVSVKKLPIFTLFFSFLGAILWIGIFFLSSWTKLYFYLKCRFFIWGAHIIMDLNSLVFLLKQWVAGDSRIES